jgi:hypothetical protein
MSRFLPALSIAPAAQHFIPRAKAALASFCVDNLQRLRLEAFRQCIQF